MGHSFGVVGIVIGCRREKLPAARSSFVGRPVGTCGTFALQSTVTVVIVDKGCHRNWRRLVAKADVMWDAVRVLLV